MDERVNSQENVPTSFLIYMKFYKVSWEQYEKDCLKLAKQLNGQKFDKIVAISRGGLIAARILSDLLSIPISHITIESYQNLKQKKTVTITEVPSARFYRQRILLVDEIADSGKTFKRAVSYFKNFQLKKISTLALYIKSHCRPCPDYFANQIDAWIIFPYELRETYEAFKKLYKNEAKEKLKEAGFKEWEIERI